MWSLSFHEVHQCAIKFQVSRIWFFSCMRILRERKEIVKEQKNYLINCQTEKSISSTDSSITNPKCYNPYPLLDFWKLYYVDYVESPTTDEPSFAQRKKTIKHKNWQRTMHLWRDVAIYLNEIYLNKHGQPWMRPWFLPWNLRSIKKHIWMIDFEPAASQKYDKNGFPLRRKRQNEVNSFQK